MANKIKVIRARVPVGLKARLDKFCEARAGRTESDVIREAILDYLAREESNVSGDQHTYTERRKRRNPDRKASSKD